MWHGWRRQVLWLENSYVYIFRNLFLKGLYERHSCRERMNEKHFICWFTAQIIEWMGTRSGQSQEVSLYSGLLCG